MMQILHFPLTTALEISVPGAADDLRPAARSHRLRGI